MLLDHEARSFARTPRTRWRRPRLGGPSEVPLPAVGLERVLPLTTYWHTPSAYTRSSSSRCWSRGSFLPLVVALAIGAAVIALAIVLVASAGGGSGGGLY